MQPITELLEGIRKDLLYSLESRFGAISTRLIGDRLIFKTSTEETAILISSELTDHVYKNRLPITVAHTREMIFLIPEGGDFLS